MTRTNAAVENREPATLVDPLPGEGKPVTIKVTYSRDGTVQGRVTVETTTYANSEHPVGHYIRDAVHRLHLMHEVLSSSYENMPNLVEWRWMANRRTLFVTLLNKTQVLTGR